MARLPAQRRGFERSHGGLIETLRGEIDRLFEDFFATPGGWGMRLPTGPMTFSGFFPDVDVIERADRYVIRAELPGVKPDEVEVSCTEENLVIKGEKAEESVEEGDTYYTSERSFGEFERTIPLPKGVDFDRLEARFENGVLEIVAPKSEDVRPRRIEVKRADAGAREIEAGRKGGAEGGGGGGAAGAAPHKHPAEGARERGGAQGERERERK
jgi:HSP20 family protein